MKIELTENEVSQVLFERVFSKSYKTIAVLGIILIPATGVYVIWDSLYEYMKYPLIIYVLAIVGFYLFKMFKARERAEAELEKLKKEQQ